MPLFSSLVGSDVTKRIFWIEEACEHIRNSIDKNGNINMESILFKVDDETKITINKSLKSYDLHF